MRLCALVTSALRRTHSSARPGNCQGRPEPTLASQCREADNFGSHPPGRGAESTAEHLGPKAQGLRAKVTWVTAGPCCTKPVQTLDTIHDCGGSGFLNRVLLKVCPSLRAIKDGTDFVRLINACHRAWAKLFLSAVAVSAARVQGPMTIPSSTKVETCQQKGNSCAPKEELLQLGPTLPQ